MEDEVLQMAYKKAEEILLHLKSSPKPVTGISLIEPDFRYNYLTVDILTKYELVRQSTPDFANSIITINKKGVQAVNSGLKGYIEEQDQKEELKKQLEKIQFWVTKYWWVIMILTSLSSAIATWLLSKPDL